MQPISRLFAAVLAVAVPVAGASAQSITSITANWANAVGNPSTINNSNPDAVLACWPAANSNGDCASLGSSPPPLSGYVFERSTTPLSPGINSPFVLGQFTHHNFTVPSGSSITSIDLLFSFTIEGLVINDTWTLDHEETSNTTLPCTYPGTPNCPDRVSFSIAGGAGPTPFMYDGQQYIVSLFGFGATADEASLNPAYITQECQSNTTVLWAELTTPSDTVPEPATMTLLATGLAGMAAARRRRKS